MASLIDLFDPLVFNARPDGVMMTDSGKLLEELNDRSREVFRRVVDSYLASRWARVRSREKCPKGSAPPRSEM